MNAEPDADDSDFWRCWEVVCRLTAGRFPFGPGGRYCIQLSGFLWESSFACGRALSKRCQLARLKKAPIAIEAIERIDVLFAIEREINGLIAQERRAVRQERSRPLIVELEAWLHEQRRSSKSDTAQAIDYSLKRWTALTRFVDDGRLCMSNNAAERILRCVAVGRHNWTFAGSDDGGRRAAAMYTLIETAKLNDIDPQAWLAYLLAHLADHPAKRISELLPWNWRPPPRVVEAA